MIYFVEYVKVQNVKYHIYRAVVSVLSYNYDFSLADKCNIEQNALFC